MNPSTFAGLLVTALAAFFAMCNPFANTPIFVSMTAGDDAPTKKAVARRAAITAFIIVTVMAVAGKLIGLLFGLTLPAFQLAAGFLVFMIGYQMVSGQTHGAEAASDSDIQRSLEQELDKAVSPLGIPILAGGGTISATIVLSASSGFEGIIATILGFTIIIVINYFMFLSGDAIERKLGHSGINAISRIMGLVLATIGVGVFLDGLAGALNAFLPTIASLLNG
jgi:multiple antibiotic resistance protein